MNKYITYATWVATPIVIKLCFNFEYSLLICAIFLAIEMLYFVINKYLGNIIKAFSNSAALKYFVFTRKDYNKFLINFVLRISFYVLGLTIAALL